MERFAQSLDDLVGMGPQAVGHFAASLDPLWIEEALSETDSASLRRRKLPAECVVWLVIGMALYRDRSIAAVVEHLALVSPRTKKLSGSAVPPARRRLGPAPLRWLFRRLAEEWASPDDVERFHGLDLLGFDGSTLRVQDSDENFAHFGKPGGRGGKNDAGYPQLRLAALLNLRSRMLVDAAFGPIRTSELALVRPMVTSIPDDSLTLFDRGFNDYLLLASIASGGSNRHVLVRLKSDARFEPVGLLPDGTARVLWRPTKALMKKHPQLPAQIEGRVVAYQHASGAPGRLFVTLLDSEEYPATELIALYHERWELELAYDELKTHLLERAESLRSLSPENVEQELWGILTLYNLVRHEMVLVAVRHDLSAERISFRSSVLWMRDFWLVTAWGAAPGNIPKYLKDLRATLGTLVLPKRRSERRYPRHVKIKMSNYPRNRGKRSSGQPP